ncbi:MAG: hypothetical protein U9R25_03430 [Chloroflexota bacterium]|nr:hypothetical protein [Chloroflexota bacterium]
MNDLLLSPLGPALLLGIAGLLLRVLIRPQRSSTLALSGLGPLFVSLVLLVRTRAVGSLIWQTTWRPLVLPPLDVLWALDGWNSLALLLLLLTGAIAILLTWRLPGMRTGPFHGLSLLLLASAALTVVSDNLLALGPAWVATDILLIARMRGGKPMGSAAPIGLVAGGSLLIFLAIGITSLSPVTASLVTATLPSQTVALILLAAALRMTAYPLHLWRTPDNPERDRGTQLLISGIILVTGAWMLGRLFTLGASIWFSNPLLPPLLALLTLLAGTAAWTARGQDQFPFLTTSRATWLWLTLSLAPAVIGRELLGWAMVAALLGLMLTAVGQASFSLWRWQVPTALAAATLAGVPLTAGLASRALISPASLLLFLLMIVGDSLVLATVFQTVIGQKGTAETSQVALPAPGAGGIALKWPVIRSLTAFSLAAIPVLLWGIFPASLASFASFGAMLTVGDLLGALGVTGLIGIILSLVLGYGLTRVPMTVSLRSRLARITDLSWLLRGIEWVLTWVDSGWRAVTVIFEGEGYFGWLMLMVLFAWLIIRP